MTLSRAWLDLRSVRTLDAQLLEAYLDSTDATERRVIRFCLRDLQWGMDWESATDAELFRGVADRMDRYPLTLAAALPAQIERFRRAGLLSAAFDRSPSAVVASATGATAAGAGAWSGEPAAVPAELYELAGGRFVIDRPFPGSRGRSLDVGIDRESGDRVLVTKLFVLDDEPIPSEAELMPAHEGISTLLHLGRVDLADGLANVMVEALPDAMRSDERLPLGLDQSLALADRVAAILGTVHAAGHCVTGLRPELTFVDARDQVTLVPRGDLLRRLTWPAGPKIEGQLPPFRDLYLAPELLLGQHATAASDVYSLCAMLACWIRSVHPFARDSAAAQLQAMLNDSPDCRGLPVPLYGTVALGLSAEPGRRPTLAEFRRALGGRHPA